MECKKCELRVKTEGDGDCDHPIGFTGKDGDKCPLEVNCLTCKYNCFSHLNKCRGCKDSSLWQSVKSVK